MKLRIKETAWGINRVSGGYRKRVTADVRVPCVPGDLPIYYIFVFFCRKTP